MIKVTIERLHQSNSALAELSQESLPITIGFRIAKTITAVNEEIKAFEDVRKKKLEGLCKKDKDGNILLKKDAKGVSTGQVEFKDTAAEQQFAKEINELFKVEVELKVDTISIRMMEEKVKEEGIKPAILVALDWLFV